MHVTIRELRGLGFLSGSREADSATRMRLHTASIALANDARNSPINRLSGIPARADQFIAEVNSYAPWPEESWCINCYGNTTMVRNNFFLAKNEALRRMGDASRVQIGAPSQPTNLFTETAANMPAAVAERAREIARGEFDTPEQRAAFGGTGGARSSVSVEAAQAEAARAAQERERARLAQIEADRRDAEARARASADERARMEAALAAARAQQDAAGKAQQAAEVRAQQEAVARAQQERDALVRVQAERSRQAQAAQAAAMARLEADRAAAAQRVEDDRVARARAAAEQRAAEERAAGENRQIAVGLVSSITNAAAAFGSQYAQSQADKAAAKAARKYAVQPAPMPLSFPRPAAPAAGMDKTQMVMIGVGVAAVASVGLIMALRSGGDDDED